MIVEHNNDVFKSIFSHGDNLPEIFLRLVSVANYGSILLDLFVLVEVQDQVNVEG